MQHVRAHLMNATTAPRALGHGGKQLMILVIAVDEARGPRPLLQPVEPVVVNMTTVPHISKVPRNDHRIVAREFTTLRPLAQRQAVGAVFGGSMYIASDIYHCLTPYLEQPVPVLLPQDTRRDIL